MTLLYRFVSLALFTSFIAGCNTVYMDKPMQPAPVPVYPMINPQPIPSAAVYPRQPSVGASAPSISPKTAPATTVLPAAQPQPIVDDNISTPVVAPAREPGSISQLPDPS